MYQIEVDIYSARPRILVNRVLKNLESIKPVILKEILNIKKDLLFIIPLSGRLPQKQ